MQDWFSQKAPGILFLILAAFAIWRYGLDSALDVIDGYFTLFFSSWPAVVFLLGILLLFTQKEAVAQFIRSIDKLGPSGLSTHSPTAVQIENKEELGNLEEQTRAENVPALADAQNVEQNELENLRAEVDTLKKQKIEETKKRLFERVYGSIFGSQLHLLIALSVRDRMPYSEALQYYNNVIKTNPTLSSYPADSYFNFLITPQLIKRDFIDNTDYVVINEMGKEFLEYVKSENLTFNRLY